MELGPSFLTGYSRPSACWLVECDETWSGGEPPLPTETVPDPVLAGWLSVMELGAG
jgi:hypothetical protein